MIHQTNSTVLPRQHLPLVKVSLTPRGGILNASVTRTPMGLASDGTDPKWRSEPNHLTNPGQVHSWWRPAFFKHLLAAMLHHAGAMLQGLLRNQKFRQQGNESSIISLSFLTLPPTFYMAFLFIPNPNAQP